MREKYVYLVRHGQTTHNRDGLVQDGTVLLTEQGEQQAIRVAERVQHLDFDHLVVSDFERTKLTAEPIARATKKEPIYSKLFRENRAPSEFVHQSKETPEHQAYVKAVDEHWLESDWHFADEENPHELLTRASAALASLEELEGDVVVVSHGRFLRALICIVLCRGRIDLAVWHDMFYSIRSTNTGITVILHDSEQWRLRTWNDHAHFAE